MRRYLPYLRELAAPVLGLLVLGLFVLQVH